ncbi:MAG: Qat anti-phage system associated protein QatB [Armatimonadota bacterium]
MGTSQSSPGAPGGVPLIPPWVPAPDNDGPDQPPLPLPLPAPMPTPTPLAPNRRFTGARRSLGSFAQSGSERDLKRSLKHYVQKGLGGTRTATRRFEGTVHTASALYQALSAMGQGQTVGGPLDPALLAGRTAPEIVDAIIEAVGATNGTLDAEASRESRKEAFSELYKIYPDADLFNLSEDQRFCVIEQFVSSDIVHRFQLDIGKVILEKSPNLATGLGRLHKVRSYIKQEVSRVFRGLRADGHRPDARRISNIVRDALGRVFRIFGGYVQ